MPTIKFDPLVVPGDVSVLKEIRDYVLVAAKEAGLDNKVTRRLQLAVDELATNIIVHGYEEAGLEGKVYVEAYVDDAALVVTIEDTGDFYDPNEHIIPDETELNKSLGSREIGGLGIFLALNGVDAFQYEHTGSRNRNILVVNRPKPEGSKEIAEKVIQLLYVEPEVDGCPDVVEYLIQDGYQVTCVRTGVHAMDTLDAKPVDLVLIGSTTSPATVHDIMNVIATRRGHYSLPVIVVASLENVSNAIQFFHLGAADFIIEPFLPELLSVRIRAVLEKEALLKDQHEQQHRTQKMAADFKQIVLPSSLALLSVTDFDQLLERILVQAQMVCNADGATLYLRKGDALEFSIVLTKSLEIALGGTTDRKVSFMPLFLYDTNGNPNHHLVAAHVALTGKTINIADIYSETDEFDFSGTKAFDAVNNYRSVSTLTIPVQNENDDIVGVVQLLNAIHPETGEITTFDSSQQLVTEMLVAQVAIALKNQEIMKRQAALQKLEYDVQVGRNIQTSFLPNSEMLPQPSGWEISARLFPAREVAGDFYDIFDMGRGWTGFLVADVCDKGVGAALFMALMRSLMRAFAQQSYPTSIIDAFSDDSARDTSMSRAVMKLKDSRRMPPSTSTSLAKAITLTNDYVSNTHMDLGMFATMFAGMVQENTGTILYCNGGHNPPVVLDANGTVKQRLKATGPAVGMLPRSTFEIHELTLDEGDTLLAFTDGVPEARAEDRSFYGEGRMLDIVTQKYETPKHLIDALDADLQTFVSNAIPFDDITMMAVKRSVT